MPSASTIPAVAATELAAVPKPVGTTFNALPIALTISGLVNFKSFNFSVRTAL